MVESLLCWTTVLDDWQIRHEFAEKQSRSIEFLRVGKRELSLCALEKSRGMFLGLKKGRNDTLILTESQRQHENCFRLLCGNNDDASRSEAADSFTRSRLSRPLHLLKK